MAQATYAQDVRQLLHFRRTLVSFGSRYFRQGLGLVQAAWAIQKSLQNSSQKTVMDQWRILRFGLMQQTFDFSMGKYYTEDMAENRRPTINSILKDPAASDWLKAAVRSALECDPADVMRDAQTLVTLMIGYTSRFGYPARRQWPRKKAAP